MQENLEKVQNRLYKILENVYYNLEKNHEFVMDALLTPFDYKIFSRIPSWKEKSTRD